MYAALPCDPAVADSKVVYQYKCSRFPKVTGPYRPQHTCGEWEPPWGKVCGNCTWWAASDAAAPGRTRGRDVCQVRLTCTHDSDTCNSWRFNGIPYDWPDDD
jgi:hypothetical protein